MPPHVPEKYFKHLEGSKGLYEIRVDVGSNTYRIFSFFDKGNLVVLGNAFQKKTQKTPKQELVRAIRIMEEYHDENKKDLYKLVEEVSKQNTEVEKVRCSSWINNIDSFVELFPIEYRESLKVKDSNNFLGIWQQFLNKDGEIKEDLMEDFLKKVNISKSLEQLKDAFPCKVLIGEVDIQYFRR